MTDREIAIALISEVRNALVPARFHLNKVATSPEATDALTAIQRVLDYATECAERLMKNPDAEDVPR
ncbi:MAG TPA: hypothetical protein VJU58_14665 [Microbacterium sp.]|nr:hypothetical protein [Microbacterium sp.]